MPSDLDECVSLTVNVLAFWKFVDILVWIGELIAAHVRIV